MSFPVSESSSRTALQPAPSIQPFRRISLPNFPSVLHRNSIVSVSSFDSFPEDQETRPGMIISVSNPANVRLAKPILVNTGRSRHPIESPKRRSAKRSSSARPGNDAKVLQRKQVVDEFHATEKTYVDGLELIYSVSAEIFLKGHCSHTLAAFPYTYHYISGNLYAFVRSSISHQRVLKFH